MIKYTLKCDQDHSFDSWFQSADAFDKLVGGGHLSCALCGSSDVSKSLMTPKVRPARNAVQTTDQDQSKALSVPQNEAETALSEMRKQVEANSDYVGTDFTKTARDMHLGDAPERSIYGTANAEQAKALIDDGVPVIPLPFVPKAKAN
ncbi:MAG: DUF1178 family protein [Ascidiaceihabitans sp.]|jgi:hypothetical protein|nr:DUF1178 family protein [Ascidiaceihabitans sp.]